MRTAILGVVCAAACGRVGFEPLSDSGGDVPGDGSAPDSALDSPQSTACDQRAVVVGIGRINGINTCQGADDVDGCGSAGRQEVLYRFVPPATTLYYVSAYDAGTQNLTMAALGYADAGCTVVASACAGSLGIQLDGGRTYDIVIEATASSCAAIDLDIRTN